MYTVQQVLAIPQGFTAKEQGEKVLKRVLNAISRVRREIAPETSLAIWTIYIPGFAPHPNTTAYNFHYKIELFSGQGENTFRILYCTCGQEDLGLSHKWSPEDWCDMLDPGLLHLLESLPYVLAEVEKFCGPEFGKRVAELNRWAEAVGPYLVK